MGHGASPARAARRPQHTGSVAHAHHASIIMRGAACVLIICITPPGPYKCECSTRESGCMSDVAASAQCGCDTAARAPMIRAKQDLQRTSSALAAAACSS